jgi:hypothetical protein
MHMAKPDTGLVRWYYFRPVGDPLGRSAGRWAIPPGVNPEQHARRAGASRLFRGDELVMVLDPDRPTHLKVIL